MPRWQSGGAIAMGARPQIQGTVLLQRWPTSADVHAALRPTGPPLKRDA